MEVGSRDAVSFEIGDFIDDSNILRKVDIWICNFHVTKSDNIAHLPTFLAACADDAEKNYELNTYTSMFEGMGVEEIHDFILSTRDVDSPNYNIEGDMVFINHRVFDWGPNTDGTFSFLVPKGEKLYLTISSENEAGKKEYFGSSEIDLIDFQSSLKELSVYLEE